MSGSPVKRERPAPGPAAGLESPAKASRISPEDRGTPAKSGGGGHARGGRIEEYQGDLFAGAKTPEGEEPFSVAHSIGADMKFSAPLASAFAQKFGRMGEVKAQGKVVGEVAVLKQKEGKREYYSYNLVTKPKYNVPATLQTLEASLEAMRQHALQHNVHRIAMPKLGCGLDKLAWADVQRVVRKVFFLQPTGQRPPFHIRVCSLDKKPTPTLDSTPTAEAVADGGAGAGGGCGGGGNRGARGTFEERKGDMFVGIQEREGGGAFSLCHCVSVDMVMGKGIATAFKQKFGKVAELKAQRKGVGECAVLEEKDPATGRPYYVYYLVTKEKYWNKPTMQSLERSCAAMRTHALAHSVTRLAMPRLGCGLDKLEWPKVSAMLKRVFNIDQPAAGVPPFDIRVFTL